MALSRIQRHPFVRVTKPVHWSILSKLPFSTIRLPTRARIRISDIFLPHIVRMPQDNQCRDSYLCPVTQAGPYFLAKAYPDLCFFSPLLDFTRDYEADTALVEVAVRELGKPRGLAKQAWAAAVRAQTEVERALWRWGSAPWPKQ
jgi:hypothetical protein